MIKSLRTTQIAFFRFATLCSFSGGEQTRYKKYPCKGSCKRKSYETICENIVSRNQTLVSSLPREAVFRRRRPKAHFMTGPHRQPSNKACMGQGRLLPSHKCLDEVVNLLATNHTRRLELGTILRDKFRSILMYHFTS